MMKFKHAAALAFSTAMLSSCTAQVPSAGTDWKPECVGRMTISLPSVAEAGALPFREMKDEIAVSNANRGFKFSDGVRDDYAQLAYVGSMYISQPLTASQAAEVFAAARKQVERHRAPAKAGAPGATLPALQVLKAEAGNYAWHVGTYHVVVKQVGDRILVWKANGPDESVQRSRVAFDHVQSGLALRRPHEVPAGEGVCLPYAFIHDNGQPWRAIGTGFRLQDYPDVTIWLEDRSLPIDQERDRGERATARYLHDDFWTQYQNAPTGQKIESLWSAPSVRSVSVDGQEGTSTFVRIRRPDGSTDFGYLALTPGKKGAAQDTPKLSYYMIQESSRAKAAGKAPLDEKAFLALAQQVATSVRHRPVR